ncbi:hypothetical protein [Pelagerythrobacter sp.]|uniref:hypothetical protein n=1 Tax=Pelagerythrobacter sp. TaxID=2800702 RepID=UPI0035AD828E
MDEASHTYLLFGQRFRSDIALPELGPELARDSRRDDTTAIVIRRGAVPEDGTQVGPQIGPFSHAAPDALWLRIPNIARYLVQGGNRVTYAPEPGIDDDSVRVFLLGSCIGTLLLQRGQLVLHGNAFAIGDGCALCVGPSGAGKSTLAARMMQRGHPVIADDVCPIDAEGRAIPGMARMKLWQDTADRLAIDTSRLRRIRPGLAKYDLPMGETFHAQPLPVRAIYVLSPWNRETFAVKELSGLAKFQALRDNTYRFRFLKGMALGPGHMRQCGDLAARVPVAELHRPRQGFDIDGLVDAIRDDFVRRNVLA